MKRLYYYYSLTLFSFNGTTLSSKEVYISSKVNLSRITFIIGQLIVVTEINNSWFRDKTLSRVVTGEKLINFKGCKKLEKEASYPLISKRTCCI